MSIEDIDYLYKNSVKENIIIKINSSERDKNIYPNPNNYKLYFDKPFKYVYGIDIIDAALPRTQYQIDNHNNKLYYLNNDEFPILKNDVDPTAVENGTILENNKLYRIHEQGSINWNDISVEDLSDLSEEDVGNVFTYNGGNITGDSGKIHLVQLTENYKYEITDIGAESSIWNEISYENLSTPAVGNVFTYNGGNITGTFNAQASDVGKVKVPVIQEIELDVNDYDIAKLVIHINNKLDKLNHPTLTAKELTSPENNSNIIFFFNDSNNNTDNFLILAYKSTCSEALGFDKLTNKLPSDNEIQTYDRITSTEVKDIYMIDNNITGPKWVELENVAKELYWNSLTQQTQQQEQHNKETYLTSWYDGKSEDDKIRVVIPNDYNKILYGTYKSKDNPQNGIYLSYLTDDENKNIIVPNLLNLTGDRFIKLRSNTIEQYLPSFYSGSNSIGLGLFKLSVSGYTDERFDYTSIEYKDLHPIGKLSSIDLRFEMLDGSLYNFRSVNHHFLLNIKYYAPTQSNNNVNKKDYVLNTNYNPNLLDYKRTQYEKDDNSEDENNELANNFKKNFLEKEKEYEYSSDEDLDFINPYIGSSGSESSIDTSSEEENGITPFHPSY